MVLLLAACGQRGPLYLPDSAQEPVSKNEIDAGEIAEDQIDADQIDEDETDEDETGDELEKTPGN